MTRVRMRCVGPVIIVKGTHGTDAGGRNENLGISDRSGQPEKVTLWLRTSIHHACRIFGASFQTARLFRIDKILPISCWANSADIAKDLRKVLLGLETTSHGDIQYAHSAIAQHRLSTLNSLAHNELMRGFAR